MSVRVICIHVRKGRTNRGLGPVDLLTYIDEMDDLDGVYEFCERRGASGTSGPLQGGCSTSLSEALDLVDGLLFPDESAQTFWVHLCNPMHLDKTHRSFWIEGTPERLVQLIQRELHDWACGIWKQRMALQPVLA